MNVESGARSCAAERGALLDSKKHAHLPRDSGNAATRKDKRPHDQIFGT
jgi:hypothetical protein